jgi:dTDP-4-dehydrorhamnose reductase
MTKVLITGGQGLVARALLANKPDRVEVIARSRLQLDIRDRAAVGSAIGDLAPDVVINAAAFTACDLAETEIDHAHAVNAQGVANLAEACRANCTRLVQISSDYVFDGKADRPYRIDDAPNPINVYGHSKLKGERAAVLLPGSLVIRTAWVYGAPGADFVSKILGRLATMRSLPVVDDQIGTPTNANSLARAIWRLVSAQAEGIHHYTDDGQASWFDFATAIRCEAIRLGMIDVPARISKISSCDFDAPASRPAYSVLDKSTTWPITGEPRCWDHELGLYLEGIAGRPDLGSPGKHV